MEIMHKYFKYLGVITLFCVFCGFAPTADAMVVRGGETYKLDKHTLLEGDLYVLSKRFAVLGTTTGDVFAVGTLYVEQDGSIAEDALIAGGAVKINGVVRGDLRAVGGQVNVTGRVIEDAILGGRTVIIEEDAVIEGDLLVVADRFILKGEVKGLVEMYVRTAKITGTVGSSLGATIRESLTITGSSTIAGDVVYKAPYKAVISETSSVGGTVKYTEINTSESFGSFNYFALMLRIVMSVTSAVIFAFFFPRYALNISRDSLDNEDFLRRTIKGLIILIAWPLLAFLCLFTIVLSIPALFMMLVYGAVIFLALIMTLVVSGVLLAKWLKKNDDKLSLPWVSLGAIVITVVLLVPFAGWVIPFVLFLLSFDAVCTVLYKSMWLNRKVGEKESSKIKNNYEEGDKEIK